MSYEYSEDGLVEAALREVLVKVFLEKDLLKEQTGQLRDRIYVCEPYLKVFAS